MKLLTHEGHVYATATDTLEQLHGGFAMVKVRVRGHRCDPAVWVEHDVWQTWVPVLASNDPWILVTKPCEHCDCFVNVYVPREVCVRWSLRDRP